MPVTINLSTLFAGLSYYAGATAERYEETTILTNIKVFVRKDTLQVSQPGSAAVLVFNNVPAGKHRFCVRSSAGTLMWRSTILNIATGNETFNFSIINVPVSETTFAAKDLEDEIDVPINEDIPDLDEDLNLTAIDVTIKHSHIDIDGEGNIAKGDDWTIIKSDLDFDYDFNLNPVDSIDHKKFLTVVSLNPLTLNMSNFITGIGVFFMQDKINSMIKTTIQKIINKQIRKQIETRTKDQFGDSPALDRVTATVLSSQIVEAGTVTVDTGAGFPGMPVTPVTIALHKLEIALDISIPSELISIPGSGGCFSTVLLAAAGLSALLFSGLFLLLK